MDRPRKTWHGHHTERDLGRARPKGSPGSFPAQLVGASLLVAIVVWNAVPVASSLRIDDEIVTPDSGTHGMDETPAQPQRRGQRPERA